MSCKSLSSLTEATHILLFCIVAQGVTTSTFIAIKHQLLDGYAQRYVTVLSAFWCERSSGLW